MHCHSFHTNSKWPLALVRIRIAGLLQVARKILRSPVLATRMHRLFKPPIQRLMRGRRVESPKAAPRRQLGRHQHDNDSGCNPASGSARGVADLALQPWLGILSQQRFGSRRVGPRTSPAPRTHISPREGLPCSTFARPTSRNAREPRASSPSVCSSPFVDRLLNGTKNRKPSTNGATMLKRNSRRSPAKRRTHAG
jgi:hypothetical protein